MWLGCLEKKTKRRPLLTRVLPCFHSFSNTISAIRPSYQPFGLFASFFNQRCQSATLIRTFVILRQVGGSPGYINPFTSRSLFLSNHDHPPLSSPTARGIVRHVASTGILVAGYTHIVSQPSSSLSMLTSFTSQPAIVKPALRLQAQSTPPPIRLIHRLYS
ncbi:hypothetical protein BJ912DRAFT_109308 [Pholiota molesta]|nr:hypothetical protein BJ912DRAFT_109308 [Pholiota molesta]